jgi:hypothetical protein
MASQSKNGNGKKSGAETARGAATAYESGRKAAGSSLSSARQSVSGATRKTAQSLSSNPAAALAGGFVVGALAGVIIPATRRERDALQPIGQKVTDAARQAARQAAESSRAKMDQLTGQVVNKVGSQLVDAVAPKE